MKETDFNWKNLYVIGGIAVFANLVLMLVSVIGYILWPYAAGVTPTQDIYTLVQTNIWAAFIALDLGVSITKCGAVNFLAERLPISGSLPLRLVPSSGCRSWV